MSENTGISAAFLRSIPTNDPVSRIYFRAAADRMDALEMELRRLTWLPGVPAKPLGPGIGRPPPTVEPASFFSQKILAVAKEAAEEIDALNTEIRELRQTADAALAERERLREEYQSVQTTRDDEIGRLRTWLHYIEGNFRDHRECAEEALRGDPPPEGFTQ